MNSVFELEYYNITDRETVYTRLFSTMEKAKQYAQNQWENTLIWESDTPEDNSILSAVPNQFYIYYIISKEIY